MSVYSFHNRLSVFDIKHTQKIHVPRAGKAATNSRVELLLWLVASAVCKAAAVTKKLSLLQVFAKNRRLLLKGVL